LLRFLLLGHDPGVRDRHLVALGLEPLGSDGDSSAFDGSFVEAFFPNYEGPSHAWGAKLVDEGLGAVNETSRQLRRTWAISRKWRFFETESGLVGLGPLKAKSGDTVCILHGSDVPVVLRKHGSSLSHVGVCFVSGLMRDEAAKLRRLGRRDVEVMRLV